MEWHPDSGETLLYRTSGRFASGFAAPVSGLRSFRDTAGNDIQSELAGWPEGKPFVLWTKKDQAVGRTVSGIFKAVPLLIDLAVWASGSTSHGNGPDVGGKNAPQEPQDEVEDFPVIWAAPGTVARTLPWQLDPARAPKGFHTDLVVTDRRLVVLGHEQNPGVPAHVLWHTQRETIATTERREFSEDRSDLKIVFTDGSWTRLTTALAGTTARLVQHLTGSVRLLAESELSAGQRERVAAFMAGLPANAEPPTLTLLPSGTVEVSSQVPHKRYRGMFDTHSIHMGADGGRPTLGPGDLS